MKVWMIVNRNGNPHFNAWGEGFSGKTRKACIESFCDFYSQGFKIDGQIWASWQRQGYDCVRLEVKK